MQRNHRALARAVVLIAVLSPAIPRAAGGTQPDEAPLRNVVVQFTEAWNRADARAAAATFTRHGVLIAGDGTQTTGATEIEQYLAKLFATTSKGTRLALSVTDVRFLTRDVALLRADGGFLMPGEAAVTAERRGVQAIVLVRDGETWRAALVQRTRAIAYGRSTGR